MGTDSSVTVARLGHIRWQICALLFANSQAVVDNPHSLWRHAVLHVHSLLIQLWTSLSLKPEKAL